MSVALNTKEYNRVGISNLNKDGLGIFKAIMRKLRLLFVCNHNTHGSLNIRVTLNEFSEHAFTAY